MVSDGGLGSKVFDKGLIFNLKLLKLPCAGGLQEIIAVFPLRTLTERFDGGSGTKITPQAKKNINFIITLKVWI